MQSMIVSGGSGGGPGFGGGGPEAVAVTAANINVMLTPKDERKRFQRADSRWSSAGSCLDWPGVIIRANAGGK